MSLDIEPRNPDAGVYGMPNGFWPAFCVETPVCLVMGCEYTDRGTIKYEHDGYVGEWISEEDALTIYKLLLEYVKTDEYKKHRYFADRQGQMEHMLKFLPICGGFRMVH